MVYRPRGLGAPSDVAELARFVEDELKAIERAQAETIALELRPTHREPERPREGMIVYADGSDWNPGSGVGVYVYDGNAWARFLDDYEEGTFTPQLTFGGGSTGMTGTFTGSYTKIGDRVFGELRIVLTAKGSSTGTALITGLPFTAGATAIGSIQVNNMAAGTITMVTAPISSGTATVSPQRYAAGALTALAETDFTDTSVVTVSFQYKV